MRPRGAQASVPVVGRQEAVFNDVSGKRLGWAVAISADGATVAALAPLASAKLYVYTRSGSTWTQQAELSGLFTPDTFGRLWLSGDGNTLLALNSSGNPVVLFRAGSTWSLQYTAAATATPVGLSADGNTMWAYAAGTLYTYTRSGSTWSGPTSTALSGALSTIDAAEMSRDGTALVLAYSLDGSYGVFAGKAQIWRYSGAWSVQTLAPPYPTTSGGFGRDVAVSDDGSRVAIGAYLTSPGTAPHGYLYLRSGASYALEFTQPAGLPVALSGTGAAAIFGAAVCLRLGSWSVYGTLTGRRDSWTSVRLTPAGQRAAAGSYDSNDYGRVQMFGV